MKKTWWTLLLTICMLMVLLPATVLAAEETDSIWDVSSDLGGSYCSVTVNSWEDLEKALNTVPDVSEMDGSELTINVSDFVWPESKDGEVIDLVLDYPGKPGKADDYSMPRIGFAAYKKGSEVWEIPEHINLTCYEKLEDSVWSWDAIHIVVNGTLNLRSTISLWDDESDIVVNGTINSSQNASLDKVAKMIVNDGGSLIAERCELTQDVIVNAGGTIELGRVADVFDLTINPGAVFKYAGNGAWRLFGTLTLGDGVEIAAGRVEIDTSSANNSGTVNAEIVAEGSAVFDGTIELEGSNSRATSAITLQGEDLTVGRIEIATYDKDGKCEVIIPAGSYVKAHSIGHDDYKYEGGSYSDIRVIGTLELTESKGAGSYGANTWRRGNLILGDETNEGTIIIPPNTRLFADYTNTQKPVTGKITGKGTVKMYAQMLVDGDNVSWERYPGLFGYNRTDDKINSLYEYGYIDTGVTVWCNWLDNDCEHVWGDEVIETEPTNKTDGSKYSFCENCGTKKVEKIPATGSGLCVLTFNYPDSLCEMYAYVDGDESKKYVSGDSVPTDSSIRYEIANIADGYRIKSVIKDGTDWVERFVAYGYYSTSISDDVSFTVELELVPEVLPSVNNVTIYKDYMCNERAEEYIDVDENIRFFGKATYSDGVEYPAYYFSCVWECSTDGVTWAEDYVWGRNRNDYWPGWGWENYPVDRLNDSYDLRLRVEPRECYTTGTTVYSNIIHVNGGAVSDDGAGFTDVASDAYYYDAVSWAVAKGITNGYGSEDTFCPDLECTRGQVVTFLWRAAGSPEPASQNNPFTDVAGNAYYYKAVLWAVENGITAGYGSDTIFNPDGVCNRGQVATFMWRAAGKPSMAGAENKFTDVASGAYYYDAVLWAVQNGITNGYGSDTIFNPDGNCTRGQIVTFLYRGI